MSGFKLFFLVLPFVWLYSTTTAQNSIGNLTGDESSLYAQTKTGKPVFQTV